MFAKLLIGVRVHCQIGDFKKKSWFRFPCFVRRASVRCPCLTWRDLVCVRGDARGLSVGASPVHVVIASELGVQTTSSVRRV